MKKDDGYRRIDKITWDNGKGLDDLDTYGLAPVRFILEILEKDGNDEFLENPQRSTIAREAIERLDDVSSSLERFLEELDPDAKDCEED